MGAIDHRGFDYRRFDDVFHYDELNKVDVTIDCDGFSYYSSHLICSMAPHKYSITHMLNDIQLDY